ncbi:hypothetical protein P152DRAFT_413206 [Eremomyces bilateralis CBS 781.70]|uniref:ACB domain-containing protein n=1 Tax=Eremomyces bilateralis CBS 781.70 TaxID=1392243 RepID=A0A6G1G8R3_9PEZI|nr:uncharacterized protein P152DRAFT_413206 [Eremomyces bilateralis CBS 781.70]KAF1814413.1 hypothetical protein P152DRAFT_413206 [Eremomyces bilateralis CBS 781.70]
MSDSVDRVFSYALNTVNKVHTGGGKPPVATRLRLYGLYKQAMEGDVDGIMDRPEGKTEEAQRAREKWEAWKSQSSLSRTEAKRRYISTLIEALHKFADPSDDTRELVAELEFVWDQVKSNVPSSSSSSPLQTLGLPTGLQNPPSYPSLNSPELMGGYRTQDERRDRQAMRVVSPVSQELEDDLDDGDEFVDAPDSQYNYTTREKEEDEDRRSPEGESPRPPRPNLDPGDKKWRRRVEQALVRLTAEVAALREQLESRRVFGVSKHQRVLRWVWRGFWAVVKHMVFDLAILWIVLIWMRQRKDKRLEGAIRVLLGDAVAQVQKVGGKQISSLGKIHLSSRSTRKGSSS